MSVIFKKALEDLQPQDIEALVTEDYPEGTYVEFKQELPSRNPSGDSWLTGSPNIGDYARNQILEEIVAFANAQGGYLILGIEESKTKPPKAAGIKPLPRCAELAEKLRLQARDCISPMLPLLNTKEIVFEEDGSGVVVCYVAQSRLAPHRLEQNAHCYIRRNDRSEKMTMREIQYLTISRYQTSAQIDTKFVERHHKFKRLMLSAFDQQECYGFRITLIPISGNVWIDRVHDDRFSPIQVDFSAFVETQSININWYDFFAPSNHRPILRGSRYYHHDQNIITSQEIYSDGVIEYVFLTRFDLKDDSSNRFRPEYIFSWVGNALLTLEKVRKNSGFFNVEYGLELELSKISGELQIGRFRYGRARVIEENPLMIPRISVGSRDEFPTIMQIINRDLWDSAGVAGYSDFRIEFPDLP